MGSGYGVPFDCENLQVEEDIWQVLIFKELFYQTVGGHFFSFGNDVKIESCFTKLL
jgi:hypothetical protein